MWKVSVALISVILSTTSVSIASPVKEDTSDAAVRVFHSNNTIALPSNAAAATNFVDITAFSSAGCSASSGAIAEIKLNPAGSGGCISWASQSVNLIVTGPGCTSVTFYSDGGCTSPTAIDVMDVNGNWAAGCQTFPFNSFNTQCA